MEPDVSLLSRRTMSPPVANMVAPVVTVNLPLLAIKLIPPLVVVTVPTVKELADVTVKFPPDLDVNKVSGEVAFIVTVPVPDVLAPT